MFDPQIPDGLFGMFHSFGHEDGDVVVVIDHEPSDVDVIPLTHGERVMRDPVNDFRSGISVSIDHVQLHHQLVPRLAIIQIHWGGEGRKGKG